MLRSSLACWLVLSGAILAQSESPPPPVEERLKTLEATVQDLQTQLAKERAKPEADYVVGSDRKMSASWNINQGLLLESAQQDFKLHIGGRFDVDAAWFGASENLQYGPGGVGPLQDGANFRRVRIRFDGSAYEVVEWVFEIDVAQGSEGTPTLTGPTDVYADIVSLPCVGTFRIGHFREPFGMDALTSGNALTFLERSNVWEAFDPFRNLGMMLYDTALDDRASWAIGVFRANNRTTGDAFDYGDGEYAVTMRATALPWFADDGRCLAHVGAAYSHRSYGLEAGASPVRYRAFPEVRVGRYIFADTGEFQAQSSDLIGAEAAVNLGALNIQSEYTFVQVNDAVIDDQKRNPSFHSWYVQASYFLTGENRTYRRKSGQRTVGVFDRPVVNENFFLVRTGDAGDDQRRIGFGSGAWELAVRYTNLDVNDVSQGVSAQVLNTWTLGLNWYLSGNTKFQWNYIVADRKNIDPTNNGVAHVFAMRFHHDF